MVEVLQGLFWKVLIKDYTLPRVLPFSNVTVTKQQHNGPFKQLLKASRQLLLK